MLELVPEKYKYFYSFLNDVATHDLEEDVDGYAAELDFDLKLE